jgi:peptide/nickel transport system permease protein
MGRFLIRSITSTIITMLLVSILLFVMIEVGSGDIATKILGIFSTPEQRASFNNQLGLNQPMWIRYVDWLIGNDWRVSSKVKYDLRFIPNPRTNEHEWWVVKGDELVCWKMEKGDLIELIRQQDGNTYQRKADVAWIEKEGGQKIFWGVDSRNNAVKWVKGAGNAVWTMTEAGLRKIGDGPREYIPLRKGLLRGDPGMSMQYNRPVVGVLAPRIRNTLILAGVAFFVIMPLALLLGIFAGINEGNFLDRIISITSLGALATPEFVTGIFLILIFGIWLNWVPPVAVFTSDLAIFENPQLLILPVLTLAAIELGYVVRMTRASLVEVMDSAYIRTAIVKGLPSWRVVIFHAIRNALMAPITIIMLHVNWLVGGVVVTEVIFGYPGLGKFIYDAAIFGDANAIEAAAMVTVAIAVVTRLIGDLAYTFLNPRIRYE